MAWETDKTENTLIIVKSPTSPSSDGDKFHYTIFPFMRVKRMSDSFIAFQPLPALTPIYRMADLYQFCRIEFVDATMKDRNDLQGDIGLTNKGNSFGVRTTLESAT
jgi:hypothetical protein